MTLGMNCTSIPNIIKAVSKLHPKPLPLLADEQRSSTKFLDFWIEIFSFKSSMPYSLKSLKNFVAENKFIQGR